MFDFLFTFPFLILLAIPFFWILKTLLDSEGYHRFNPMTDLLIPTIGIFVLYILIIQPMTSQMTDLWNESGDSGEGTKIAVPNQTLVERNETIPYYLKEKKNETIPWNNEWVK